MKILIAGLSGSGKTTLADKLAEKLCTDFTVERVNADEIRTLTNNWDFSIDGRMKQVNELVNRCDIDKDIVVCDFIAPLKDIREVFDADYTVWLDTVQESQYADTDALFEPITDAHYIITYHCEENIDDLVTNIKLQLL